MLLCRVKRNVFYHMSHHPYATAPQTQAAEPPTPCVFVKEDLLLEKAHYHKHRYNRRNFGAPGDGIGDTIRLVARRRSGRYKAHHFSRDRLRRSQINEHLGRTFARPINLPKATGDGGPTLNKDLAVHDNIKADLKFHGLSGLRVFLVQILREA